MTTDLCSIKLKIELKNASFFKYEHYSAIVLTQISLQCSDFCCVAVTYAQRLYCYFIDLIVRLLKVDIELVKQLKAQKLTEVI